MGIVGTKAQQRKSLKQFKAGRAQHHEADGPLAIEAFGSAWTRLSTVRPICTHESRARHRVSAYCLTFDGDFAG